MKYSAKAATLLGILLPTLETYRRGLAYWRVDFTTMFEDYLAGALLIAAAAIAARRPRGVLALLVVWGSVTGMMLLATIRQAEHTLRGGALEPLNNEVLVAKVLVLALSASGLVAAFREASRQIPDPAAASIPPR
jgi:hypothetical protein